MGWFLNDFINFVILYFYELDKMGYNFGLDFLQIIEKVKEMDGILGYILDSMQKYLLIDKVNLIVLSDYGMIIIDLQYCLIDILQIVDMKEDVLFIMDGGLIMYINLKRSFYNVIQKMWNVFVLYLIVYLKEEIFVEWYYGKNCRVMLIFVMVDEGWVIVMVSSVCQIL